MASSRRARGAGDSALPDWVWGAGLGVLALIFVGGFFGVRELTGSGNSGTCDEPLAPLDGGEINAAAFADEDAALTRVMGMLNVGDRAGAEAAFFGPVHAFTHNVDPLLRKRDQDAAKELCEAVLDMENGFALNEPPATIADSIERVREILRDAAVSLGYPRPG